MIKVGLSWASFFGPAPSLHFSFLFLLNLLHCQTLKKHFVPSLMSVSPYWSKNNKLICVIGENIWPAFILHQKGGKIEENEASCAHNVHTQIFACSNSPKETFVLQEQLDKITALSACVTCINVCGCCVLRVPVGEKRLCSAKPVLASFAARCEVQWNKTFATIKQTRRGEQTLPTEFKKIRLRVRMTLSIVRI